MHHQLKDVMSRGVKIISPEMTIREAARTMCDGDFGMMPVGENDRMIGAISDRDIAIRAVAEGKGPGTKVREIMSTGICWAYDDDTVEHAAKLMSERQVRRLPVVDHDKRDSWALSRSATSRSTARKSSPRLKPFPKFQSRRGLETPARRLVGR
jgi:CBS domain-containing protein